METSYVFPKTVPFSKRTPLSEKVLNESNLETVKDVSLSIAQELKNSLERNKKLEVETAELKLELGIRRYKIKHYNRILREKCQFKGRVLQLKNGITVKNEKLKRERAGKCYSLKQNESLKAKVARLQLHLNTITEELEEQTLKLDQTVKDLNDIREENEYLRLLVNENQVNLFDDECKSYTPDTQECVYALLNLNVTTSKVPHVIETVLN